MSAKDDVENPHKDYEKKKSDATLIADMMDEDAVKRKCIQSKGIGGLFQTSGGTHGTENHSGVSGYSGQRVYLKIPLSYKSDDTTLQNERYEEYVEHAHLPEEIVADALDEMVGVSMKMTPELRLPEKIQHLESHANNQGDSLITVVEQILRDVISTGCSAVSADWSDDKDKSYIEHRPNESLYNWRKTSTGYTMMVFTEVYMTDDSEEKQQRRHFSVESGELVVTLFRQENGGQWEEHIITDDEGNPKPPPTLPKDKPYTYIPIRVPQVPRPPLLGMAKTVWKGFKISANYYGMLHGLSPTMVIKSDEPASKLAVGFRSGIKVGQKDSVELMQQGTDGANPLKEAMESKFSSAADQGVRLISSSRAAESEEALYLRNANKQIRVDAVAAIVSREITEALRICALLEGANPDEVFFKLNVELVEEPIDVDELKELRESVIDSGLVRWADYLKKMESKKFIEILKDDEGRPDIKAYIAEVEDEQKVLAARDAVGDMV